MHGETAGETIPRFAAETFSSLKIRNFRLYFFGQAISTSGTFMQSVALAWLVLKLTGSGTALGLVMALQYAPILLLSPWGGVIADRYPKRRMLYATQSLAALLALVLGLLVGGDAIRLWTVYLLAFVSGLVLSVDNPVRQAFLIEMTGKERLPNAAVLNSSQVNLSRVAGPALAGVLIAAFGLALCFFVNAVSYLAVLVALFLMREEEFHVSPSVPRRRGQLREGFAYIRSTPILLNAVVMMAIIGTLTYEFQVSLPLLAEFTFHGNAEAYAALTVALGAGALIGGLVLAARQQPPAALVPLAAFFGVSVLLAAAAPTLPVAMLALLLVGAFSLAFTSLINATLQLESAPEMRGRVMSFWSITFVGSTAIGGPFIGWIGEHAGPRWGLAVGGVAALAAAAMGFILSRRTRQGVAEPAAGTL